MFSGTGTVAGTVAGTAGTVVDTAGTVVGTAGTVAGTVAVLAEVANSSDSAGGGAVFLKVDYSQCLIFQKLCVEMDFYEDISSLLQMQELEVIFEVIFITVQVVFKYLRCI